MDGWGGIGGNGGNDTNGNRVDRFLAGVAYLDGRRPSVIMARGYYGRTVIAAWDWRNGALTSRWVFDSGSAPPPYPNPTASPYSGQGNHSLSIADVDGDGREEIVYGAMVIDDDGKGLFSTGLRHGDALHAGDLDPARPGLEVFGIHENEDATVALGTPGAALYDARTGRDLWSVLPGGDVGRGLAADIDPRHRGAEFWTNVGDRRPARRRAASASPTAPPSANFAIWWDADPLREMLDSNWIGKWDWTTSTIDRLLTATGAMSNNGTKSTPALSADLLGDWREEVIWRARRQRVAAHLHDDDSRDEPAAHADARPAVPRRDRLAERRLQPAAASVVLHRRQDAPTAAAPDRHSLTTFTMSLSALDRRPRASASSVASPDCADAVPDLGRGTRLDHQGRRRPRVHRRAGGPVERQRRPRPDGAGGGRARQMSTLAYASSYAGSTNHRAIELAERLSGLAYPSINAFYFTSGGAEATDTSIKTARFYWKATGKAGQGQGHLAAAGPITGSRSRR